LHIVAFGEKYAWKSPDLKETLGKAADWGIFAGFTDPARLV
jgi:hypothetical protein